MKSATKLEDLPHFSVAAIHGRSSGASLYGRFSRPEFVHSGDCWLRMPDGYPFYATVTALDPATGLATLEARDELPPSFIVGSSHPWVDDYWRSVEVNAILDTAHEWTEVVFRATDAFEGSAPEPALGAQRVAPDGRAWRKAIGSLRPAERRVESGWDHEHCLLCFASIRPGDVAFVDPDDYWLCTACHENHAVPGDLSFVLPRQPRPGA